MKIGELGVLPKCAPPRPIPCSPPAAPAAAIRSPKAPAARHGISCASSTKRRLIRWVGTSLANRMSTRLKKRVTLVFGSVLLSIQMCGA